MGCTMRGSSPLANRVGWVHKTFSQTTNSRPYRNDTRQRGWMGGRGAEKARLKKRKALEEDAAKCAKLTDLFSRGQTQVATRKERHRPNDEQRNYSANVVALVNIVVALSTYSQAKYYQRWSLKAGPVPF